MAEIFLCTEVLQDDGKTYTKTHFRVVPLANYVALQEQLATLLNNLEAADKAVARNLALETRLAEAERDRDEWHARAIALFWKGDADGATCGHIRAATATIKQLLAADSADAAPQFDPDALRTPDDPLSPNYDPEYSADAAQGS